MAEITDTFRGDDAALARSIRALIELNDEGALVPHGIGGLARSLLAAAACRLEAGADQGRQPLSAAQIDTLVHTKHFDPAYSLTASDEVNLNWYRQGIRDAEKAHGIGDKERRVQTAKQPLRVRKALFSAKQRSLGSEKAQAIHCPEKLKPGGCQLHNLHCGWPKCNEPAEASRPLPPGE